jgi:hypothetical protein
VQSVRRSFDFHPSAAQPIAIAEPIVEKELMFSTTAAILEA